MNANTKLQNAIDARDSLVCVGLDTDPARIPDHLKSDRNAVLAFNQAIIKATSDLVAAYKPNLAFYEALGSSGWEILEETLGLIPEGIITIGDAKRGDIGNTARQYAKALFSLGFDFVTVNPYLGLDSVAPFIEEEERGVFILCLTSNPSSRDFQYRKTDAETLYQSVAKHAMKSVSYTHLRAHET